MDTSMFDEEFWTGVRSGAAQVRQLALTEIAAAEEAVSARATRKFTAEAEARLKRRHRVAAGRAPSHRRARLYGALAALAVVALLSTILFVHSPTPANASAGYSFQPEAHLTGVTIDRNWDFVRGDLVARITATNTAATGVTDTYEEVIPKSLANSPDNISFTPAPNQILSRDPVVVRYDLSLGTNSNRQVSYRVDLGPVNGAQKWVSIWAADAQQAKAEWDRRGRTATPGPVIALSLPPAPLLISVGQSLPLQVTGTLSGGAPAAAALLQDAAWSSANPDVAKVVSGTVTGLSAGQAVIGVQEGGQSATQLVIVSASQPAYRYRVYGTCPTGACVLYVRAGPGYSQYQSTSLLHEHDAVDIVCQTRGETVSQSGWGTSSVWDKLTNGSWITDLYVNTPNVNQFSPPIPQC